MCRFPLSGRRKDMETRAIKISAMVFRKKDQWAAWLDENHAKSSGVWLRLAKKGAKAGTVSYQEALEAALCYGWIDAQRKPENDEHWLLRFVPRGARSLWSKANREKAEALIARGEMKDSGLRAIEEAKRSGQWERAYDSPSRAVVPEDLQAALDANPNAKCFFETLDKANRYAILWRIQTVKRAETRARKIEQFVTMLGRHERIHE